MAGCIAQAFFQTFSRREILTHSPCLDSQTVLIVTGAHLCIGISEAAFRKIVLGLLTASGVALLASSLPHLLGRAS